MCAGVSKSGSPISRWMTSRPVRSIARARASTENAVSVPSRATPAASSPVCASVAPIGAHPVRPPASSAAAISRMPNFCTLPVTVIGNASTNFQ